MLRYAVRLTVVVLALNVAGLAAAGPTDAAAVGPGQRFLGEVNGDHRGAVVYVVCPGPARPGQTGPPMGGQTLATILLPHSAGGNAYTGTLATRIVSRFADDRSVGVRFSTYGVAKPIPGDLSLPCWGQGKVTFTPMPTSPTAVPDTLTVTFLNIAN